MSDELEIDINFVKTNVENLRNSLNLSQSEFADKIGMSQPNYSRAISLKSKQHFTLTQIYKIATEFHVSVDSLLGIKKEHSDREICSLFTSLIEKRKLVKIDYTRQEDIYTPFIDGNGYPDFDFSKENISYPAFIFPNYQDIGPKEAYTEEQLEDMYDEVRFTGNDDKSNQRINSYFDKFLSLYEIHLVKKIPDDAYQKVVEQFLSELE